MSTQAIIAGHLPDIPNIEQRVHVGPLISLGDLASVIERWQRIASARTPPAGTPTPSESAPGYFPYLPSPHK